MLNGTLTRVVRRETHSPRTVLAVGALVLTAAAATYVGIELVLHLTRSEPLLVTPGDAARWLGDVPALGSAGAVGALAIVVLGLVLVGLAIAPGRRSKHQLTDGPYAVVADNGVIASAVAERVRRELDVSRGAVVVGIGHRSADVTVRPEPGQQIDAGYVREIAAAELSSYGLSPTVRARARIQRPTSNGGQE
ncbi:DNA/RNA endonuclease G [Leucobacter sp. NPDC015123]|uniref:DNA/RNA endonuclease G n=1 Tax=Leucobacter sp. NPDC015123 TaxID=3364129 RepID=UPI0036F495C8